MAPYLSPSVRLLYLSRKVLSHHGLLWCGTRFFWRSIVAQRADYRCEYCQLPTTFAMHQHEPDHIIPVQHGGDSDDLNLAFACFQCNRNKGPNVGSFDPVTGALTPFFNPRLHQWDEHFVWSDAVIQPLTPKARVTVKILRLNDEDRLQLRRRLMQLKLY